jgi:hypothetical protein
MYNRNYGNSGYKSPSRRARTVFNSSPNKSHKDRLKGPIKWLAGLLVIMIILIWVFLGDFRFLLFRYPAMSGFPFGGRTYIVLFQNNYELRPTGGFISTYGELKFSSGIYRGVTFHDVYGEIDDHPRVEPPLILSALLDGEDYTGHTFRDANFDPDFTVAKDEIVRFYQMTNPDQRVDGVIALDFQFMETLVEHYEPLFVDGYELTGDNLFETLSTLSSDIDRHDEEALAARKDITGPLASKLIKKTMFPPWRIRGVLKLMSDAFEEKHMLASFNRARVQKAFSSRGWDGALPQSDAGDFLAINDANYGGMKSSRYITRDIQYELDISNRKDVLGNPVIISTLSVTLSHEGTYNIPFSGDYSGFLRSLIPLGSDILEGSDIGEDREDVEVLGEVVSLAPGESVTYTYSYELPEYVWNSGAYDLHLHKQPGTNADHYRVVVRAPQGMSFISESFDVRENLALFETNLLTDVNLNFGLTEDDLPPRVVSHELQDLNEIHIVFNESLAKTAENPNNFVITDLNATNLEITDELVILDVELEGDSITIYTEGMTVQDKERYQVTMKNITDSEGNELSPNPRNVTVVQKDIEVAPVEEPEILDAEANE